MYMYTVHKITHKHICIKLAQSKKEKEREKTLFLAWVRAWSRDRVGLIGGWGFLEVGEGGQGR